MLRAVRTVHSNSGAWPLADVGVLQSKQAVMPELLSHFMTHSDVPVEGPGPQA